MSIKIFKYIFKKFNWKFLEIINKIMLKFFLNFTLENIKNELVLVVLKKILKTIYI